MPTSYARALFVAVLAGLLAGGASAQAPGDVNGDGIVDPGDVALLASHVSGQITLDAVQQAAADVAPLISGLPVPDGTLNVADIVVLTRAAYGEIELTVSGTIDTAVTWVAGTRAWISGDVTVTGAGDLTVSQGSRLEFASGTSLSVLSGGQLDLQGAAGAPVLLTDDGSNTPGSWTGLEFDDSASSATLANAVIEYAETAIKVRGQAGLTVTDSTICGFVDFGIDSVSSPITVTDLTIDNTGAGDSGDPCVEAGPLAREGDGIQLRFVTAASSTITSCEIRGTQRAIDLSGSSPDIYGCELTDNNRGLHVGQDSHPEVTNNNLIHENNFGVYVEGDFVANRDPLPLISGNQIYDNTDQNLYSTDFGDTDRELDIDGNYWGTTSAIAIANTITDISDETISNQARRPWARFIPFNESDGTEHVPDGTLLWKDVPIGLTAIVGAGPHAIVGRVTVPLLSTLRIEAVTDGMPPVFASSAVEVGNSSELVVQGTLELVGHEVAGGPDAIVTISSAQPSPGPGDWEGIRFEPSSTDSLISYASLQHAERPVDVDGTELDISNSTISLYATGTATFQGGIRFSDGATGSILDNVIDGTLPGPPAGPGTNYGISLLNAAVTIQGNEITGNRYGVLLRGDGTLPLPAAFTLNSLHGNDLGNLRVEELTNPVLEQGGGVTWLTLDASENYWGDTNIANARATITQDVLAFQSPVSIDFSDLLDGIGGSPIVGTLVAAPIHDVAPSTYEFNPIFNEDVTIEFDLGADADVTLKICPESNDPCNNVLYQDTDSFSAGVDRSFVWDGTDGTDPLTPGAYIYVLEAVDGTPGDGVNEGTYNPTYAPQIAAEPDVFLYDQDPETGLTPADPESNLAAVWDVTLDFPSRIAVWVDGDFVVPQKPFPPGTTTVRWAARDEDGLPLGGRLGAYIWDEARMKANAVIVRGDPVVRGAPPAIEVRTNPHRVYASYGNHSSDFTYQVDQDSTVDVTLLPPGETDPANGISVYSGARTAATNHTVLLDPTVVSTHGEGMYLVHIQATSAADSNLIGTHLSAIRLLR